MYIIIHRQLYVFYILIFFLFQRELSSSNSLLGYRAMWKLLRDKYQAICKRYYNIMIICIHTQCSTQTTDIPSSYSSYIHVAIAFLWYGN